MGTTRIDRKRGQAAEILAEIQRIIKNEVTCHLVYITSDTVDYRKDFYLLSGMSFGTDSLITKLLSWDLRLSLGSRVDRGSRLGSKF